MFRESAWWSRSSWTTWWSRWTEQKTNVSQRDGDTKRFEICSCWVAAHAVAVGRTNADGRITESRLRAMLMLIWHQEQEKQSSKVIRIFFSGEKIIVFGEINYRLKQTSSCRVCEKTVCTLCLTNNHMYLVWQPIKRPWEIQMNQNISRTFFL